AIAGKKGRRWIICLACDRHETAFEVDPDAVRSRAGDRFVARSVWRETIIAVANAGRDGQRLRHLCPERRNLRLQLVARLAIRGAQGDLPGARAADGEHLGGKELLPGVRLSSGVRTAARTSSGNVSRRF